MTLSGWHVGHTKRELVEALVREMGWEEDFEHISTLIHAPLSNEKLADVLARLTSELNPQHGGGDGPWKQRPATPSGPVPKLSG